jgi:hypothetical protein
MLFKKKEPRELPINEIQNLSSQGSSDKEIIKKLKSEGYSYDTIEKSMLQAVKAGVDQPEPVQEQPQQDVFEENFQDPGDLGLGAAEETVSPEIIVEELVEGVVEEKWQKVESRLDNMENEISKVYARVKQAEQRPLPELKDERIDDYSERLEDLEARIGGLEKAFKQFLPALTRNIESLSSMIHEMKSKQIA